MPQPLLSLLHRHAAQSQQVPMPENLENKTMMTKMMLWTTPCLVAAAALGGCASETARDSLRGAGFGAAGGAVAGAIIPGLGVGEGAAIGAAGGAVVGAATSEGNRKYYRDRRGREYYLDDRGRRHYRD